MSNTFVRILVSVLTIPLILAVCFWGKLLFLGFTLVIGMVAYYEFISFAKQKVASGSLVIGLPAVLLIILNAYFNFTDFSLLAFGIVFLSLLHELFRNEKSAIINLGITFLGIFYIGLFLSSFISVREYFGDYQRGAFVIISMLATIWICDSAAYFFGLSFGKHRLFLRVSPKKSWEGAIAGFIFSIITMLAAKLLVVDFLSWQNVIVIGIILGTVGQVGDLIESLLKRDAGVKDSSNLIPGHGGIFDRFDSLIFSAPIVFLYIKYFISQ
ncbi:MAG: phosphatidate cytidylyltransferase [Ignavibacteriaceae bacterium]|nr:phosphatidate cytidylyltransferase [Ignavibacteriaceae bacterium]